MNPRRTLLKLLAAAGVFGPAGLAGLCQQALANGNTPITPGLRKVSGDVTINGKPAREGQKVGAGDTVITGRGGEAIYVIDQDAFMQRENSTVSFGGDAAKKLMRVVTGRILSVFGKGERTITVSTATLGIRGTACYIEDEGTGPGDSHARTYFCLCYGSVELVPTAAPAERTTFTTTHHDKPMYIHNDMKMPTMMVPAGVINHGDAELTLLENLVGRYPPFYGSANGRY
jgi:hypothetical protein